MCIISIYVPVRWCRSVSAVPVPVGSPTPPPPHSASPVSKDFKRDLKKEKHQ